MSFEFYKSIIEDEIAAFNIKIDSLEKSSKLVAEVYSRRSLINGTTYLDYNVPSNRCAYLYKYATLHTLLVAKYFKYLIDHTELKLLLQQKVGLNLCCLGGGPGIDVVGAFQALACDSYFFKKVRNVTVLDICGGWRNSFNRIISDVISGKVKDVPNLCINTGNFKYNLVEVNLLHDITEEISNILSKVDVIFMVKFVSTILGSETSITALTDGLRIKFHIA